MDHRVTGWQTMLRVIAATLALAHGAAAQRGTSDAGTEGDCLTSTAPAECPERCPSFDTCRIDDGRDGRLYYRVDDQRFDCDGLECRAASEVLADYCCRRGQFAPSHDGGGCSLTQGVPTAAPSPGTEGMVGLWLGALAIAIAGLLRGRTSPAR